MSATSTTTNVPTWEIEVSWNEPALDPRRGDSLAHISALLEAHGETVPPAVRDVSVSDVYYLASERLVEGDVRAVAAAILADSVTQSITVDSAVGSHSGGAGGIATVMQKPGVMDPVEASLLHGLADLGKDGVEVRTATRFRFGGPLDERLRELISRKVLANPVIEQVVWAPKTPSPFVDAEIHPFEYVQVELDGLSDAQLEELSRERSLSLQLPEMQAIRDHFRAMGRVPSDVELETLAQTWSEHCCHKTLTGRVVHVTDEHPDGLVFENLLKETIVRATETVNAPWCLSVFKDNAGVIRFDEERGVSFKVETHNHPSAIEPYGGAGTGIGGVLRDTLGTGMGAKPIVNTDVFCFGPPDLPHADVPQGALHPVRALRGVVAGVRDYGNRMGIPTASGAVYFDERYVGNPLVFCGSVGILPTDCIDKTVAPGDRIYVLGGRTGRDGIHGATFSSVELTDASETDSSGAVQIGNAITEKKVLDVLLQARDRRLYRSVTDCGAGGLSSAVGEMGEEVGASVELKSVPLKYDGLSYSEIWISEAQERMVLAVPPAQAAALEALAASEDVDCVDIGEFTGDARLRLLYDGQTVCDLEMAFVHDGRPKWERRSTFRRGASAEDAWAAPGDLNSTLSALLAMPNIASKEWIIRQYDHEVQGASVLKPLVGPGEDGPGDAVAFAPVFGSERGVVVSCGMNPCYGDLDPYRMALGAVDEALRNLVAIGGNPHHTALLDNFCWGNTDRPETLGSLVEAARACHDAAVAFGTPFISGKDSLNNEFRVEERDETIVIPSTLLISAMSVVEDVRRLISMDLKEPGAALVLVGTTYDEMGGSHLLRQLGVEGGVVPDVRLDAAAATHRAVHAAIAARLVISAHDLSEGGLAVAAAEMAFAGHCGASIDLAKVPAADDLRDDDRRDAVLLFSESHSRYLLEVTPADIAALSETLDGVPHAVVGAVDDSDALVVRGSSGAARIDASLTRLRESWQAPLVF